MKRMIYVLCWLVVGLAFGGCKRPIEDPVVVEESMVVRITPQWSTNRLPTSALTALLYGSSGTLLGAYSLPVAGGELSVPVDTYKVLLYNTEVALVTFSDKERYDLAAAKVDWLTRYSMQPISTPGRLYCSAFELSPAVLHAEPLMHSKSIFVTIKVRTTTSYTGKAADPFGVALRNMADAIQLSTGKAYHRSIAEVNQVALVYSGMTDDGFAVFSGTVFGCCKLETCAHTQGGQAYVDVAVPLPDGTNKTLTVEITDQLSQAQESTTDMEIDIKIEEANLGISVTGWTMGTADGTLQK